MTYQNLGVRKLTLAKEEITLEEPQEKSEESDDELNGTILLKSNSTNFAKLFQ